MNINIPEDFPALLKKIRKDIGLNQKDFGELIGVSQANISGYETGKFTPTKSVFLHIKNKYPNIFGNCDPVDTSTLYQYADGLSDETNDFLHKARIVIESETHWSESLKSNIDSFYKGVMSEKEYDRRDPKGNKRIPPGGDRRRKAG